ncbi:hypothetical protein BYT27DRAFT_7215883 [Phlegmacium glaucopus]|nr:hypothetical protein BYT27DRAFT_7215883 [Phlegmacium glaucopus]
MDSKPSTAGIVRTIVEHLLQDPPTLKALATVAKIFTRPCQEVLFQKLVINVRRKNVERHVLNMLDFLTANPSFRSWIRHVEIADNFTPSKHKRETWGSVVITPSEEIYSTSELGSNIGSIYALLFEKHLLPQLLDYLDNVSAISISIKNIQCSWRQFTPALGKSLIRIFQTPGFHKLYLQGLKSIPILALANFRDLRELYVKRCDLDLSDYEPIASRETGKSDNPKQKQRLALLVIQDLPNKGFEELLDHWKSNTDPAFVDMSSPRELTIYISTMKKLLFAETLLGMCQEAIETLTIHTWGLRLDTLFVSPSQLEQGLAPPDEYARCNSFYNDMGPLQRLTRPRSLLDLTLSVSFWKNIDSPGANGELDWALEMLRDFPPDHSLKKITINIRVGGGPKQLAFMNFQQYRGWNIWDDQLSTYKWSGVETFLFYVSCDCGPTLANGTDDIRSVIAKQMPSLLGSGRLSMGYGILGNLAIIDCGILELEAPFVKLEAIVYLYMVHNVVIDLYM